MIGEDIHSQTLARDFVVVELVMVAVVAAPCNGDGG